MMPQEIFKPLEQSKAPSLSQQAAKLKKKQPRESNAELRQKLLAAERNIVKLQMELHALKKSYHLLETLLAEQSNPSGLNKNSQAF